MASILKIKASDVSENIEIRLQSELWYLIFHLTLIESTHTTPNQLMWSGLAERDSETAVNNCMTGADTVEDAVSYFYLERFFYWKNCKIVFLI